MVCRDEPVGKPSDPGPGALGCCTGPGPTLQEVLRSEGFKACGCPSCL